MEQQAAALDPASARAMVRRWAKRWKNRWCPFPEASTLPFITCQLRASHSSSSFATTFDTLVVYVHPGELTARPSGGPAEQIRDALVLWHALSCVCGFSFEENLAFWLDALDLPLTGPSQQFKPTNPTIVPVVLRPFPRVVLSWDARDAARDRDYDGELQEFQMRALEVFYQPVSWHSEDFYEDWTMLKPFLPAHHQLVVPCVSLRIRLGATTKSTSNMATAIVNHLRECEELTRKGKIVACIPLAGIEFVGRRSHTRGSYGLQVGDFDTLQSLCDALPPDIGVEMRFPNDEPRRFALERCELGREKINSVFRRLIGFEGSSFAGRMRVLDLLHAFPATEYTNGLALKFEAFCSLLPYAVSLEELRLQLTDSQDLLWLAYALFHPMGSTRKLKTLVLSVEQGAEIDWKALDQYVAPKAWSTTQMDSFDRYSTPNPDARTPFVWRSVVLAQSTTMFDLVLCSVVATLPKGTPVEICDARPNFYEHYDCKAGSTVIIAPGYGMGYIDSSNMDEGITTTIKLEEQQPKACISTLHLGSLALSPEDLTSVLCAFGPSLQHLRGRTLHSPSLLLESLSGGGVLSALETIDCIEFTPEITSLDFSSLKNLCSLGLCCREIEITAAVVFLSSFRTSHRLNNVRLQVLLEKVIDGVEKRVSLQVNKLLRRMRSLRYLSVELMVDEVRFDLPPLDVGEANFGLWRRKLAFLSAVHHAHDHQDDPLHASFGQLDSSVLRRLFDDCGHSVEHVVCTVQPSSGFGQAVGPLEMQTKLNAWEDHHVGHD